MSHSRGETKYLESTRLSKQAIRVGLIDAHPIVRAGLKAVLEKEKGLDLVTESQSLARAITEIQSKKVEVVILGVREPVSQAVFDLKELGTRCPEVAPVVFTSLRSAPCFSRLLMAGARAYLLTEYGRDEVVDAVLSARRGRTIKAPIDLVLGMIRGGAIAGSNGNTEEGVPSFSRLTTREQEILNFMATGVAYRTIAETLFLAESTVKKYAHTVITKLGASNRATAVLNAHRLNLLEEEGSETPPPAP
ncbi:MAG: response regulator transcription factor [Vulcanimicrobiota bacterium]